MYLSRETLISARYSSHSLLHPQGNYKGTWNSKDDLHQNMKKYKISTKPLAMIGVFHDDPQEVEWAECRSVGAYILAEGYSEGNYSLSALN